MLPRRLPTALSIGVLAMLHSQPAHAECPAAAPWYRIGTGAGNFVTPLPIALTAGSLVTPVLMAPTGADHHLRLIAQDDLGGEHNLEPVSIATPYVLVGGLLVGYPLSVIAKHCEAQRVQAAMLQSVVFTGVTVLTLKWVTGRQWPHADRDPANPASLRADTSTRFHPFGPVLQAFPSGHTAITFAAAAALRASLPSDVWYRWLGYPVGLGVAAGMWLGDHHWASDIISGGLLGEAIGSSVGRSFSGANEAPHLALLPVPGGVTVSWVGDW
jgi:membrane-associated phospholipid phosphatase